jgi:hypothetical protein
MKANGNSAVIDIRAGDRKISIYSFDKYGKGIYENVDVKVEKSSSSELPLLILFIIFLIVLFFPKIMPLITRNQTKNSETKSIELDEEE